ncbi:MAG: hypothetical protein P8Y70_01530 [Candidatus Lokiarchaeota archaeon]
MSDNNNNNIDNDNELLEKLLHENIRLQFLLIALLIFPILFICGSVIINIIGVL